MACFPEESGIIHGFDSDSSEVLVTAYQLPGKATWIPIAEVGTKLLILVSHHPPISRADAIAASLDAAVANWSRGDVGAHTVGIVWEDSAIRIQYGAAAYKEWADDLRHAGLVAVRSRNQLRTASAFNMTCLADARWAAAGYLRSAQTSLPESSTPHLIAAADIYEDLAREISALRDAGQEFFGVWHGQKLEDWSGDLRENEAKLLERYAQLDAIAIGKVNTAIAGIRFSEV